MRVGLHGILEMILKNRKSTSTEYQTSSYIFLNHLGSLKQKIVIDLIVPNVVGHGCDGINLVRRFLERIIS